MHKKQSTNRLHDGIIELTYQEYVKLLFANIEHVNVKTELGETPIHLAAFWGKLDKFYALINMGADPLLVSTYGNNALHYACLGGKDDFIIVELVKSGINPSETNAAGETPLHLASNPRVTHYLALWYLRNNINPKNIRDQKGRTPLERAEQRGLNLVAQYWKQFDLPLTLYRKRENGHIHAPTTA